MSDTPPIDLTHVSATGATYCGRPVNRIVIVTESGTEVAINLHRPPPAGGKSPADTPMGRAILQALTEVGGGPVSGPELARLCGYAYAGRFRETLSAMARPGGDLAHTEAGYSLGD